MNEWRVLCGISLSIKAAERSCSCVEGKASKGILTINLLIKSSSFIWSLDITTHHQNTHCPPATPPLMTFLYYLGPILETKHFQLSPTGQINAQSIYFLLGRKNKRSFPKTNPGINHQEM